MHSAYVNQIATAVPPHDVHRTFLSFADKLLHDRRGHIVFRRMAERGQIDHRWSCLRPASAGRNDAVDDEGFYTLGHFPSTAARMRRYEQDAPQLAAEAVAGLDLGDPARVTHLIVISCTGLSAPGIDFDLVERFGLNPSVERTMIGFMGCYAAINGLKLARHIVRSDPEARVLMVSVELCTLHLQETQDLEQVLTFMIFGDGCAAALITSEPHGLELERFHAILSPGTAAHITWNIGDVGFDMVLSGQVPGGIGKTLQIGSGRMLDHRPTSSIDLWAVHPGGRSVLDAVETALDLPEAALASSRDVLRRYGNMSSATVLFVLAEMMRANPAGKTGCAMAFGPGLVAETMLFRAAGAA
ncbi:naringenin-chalcone synthase [Agaricicola taiwanensis]|uniref:Naringenin-chalcone synthase n=1 Tax=Agaricicola taiwanensis TaxID=591372 RepID=A0A8J2VM26_9RHOB|nr:type III polyketide synthase [Agaricicola taiwanensis]GGE29418.1 naringenin-chalcone synthase [Agaricicola taiwanensis]